MEEMKENMDLPEKKIPVWKIIIAVTACLALLLTLTVAVWWSIIGVKSFDEGMQAVAQLFGGAKKPAVDPEAEKVFQNRDQVIATMGDAKLTNGQLQIYYWTAVVDFVGDYSGYLSYMGLDIALPLDQQDCYLDEFDTWHDYFLQKSLDDWNKYQAMALEAQKAGMKLPADLQKTLDGLKDTMTKTAKENGYADADALVRADYGPGCTYEDYESYMWVYFNGYNYFDEQVKKIVISDQMLEDYFSKNEEKLTEQGIKKDGDKVYGVRHILIEVESTIDKDGKTVVTEEAWETCRQKAQALLDEWLAGDHTEQTFAEFAQKHSTDSGSNQNGGLYSGLDKNTNFVEPFKNWYLEEGRKVGDYGMVKTTYGYHIMYQSSITDAWKITCEELIYEEETAKILDYATEKNPVKIDTGKVMIGQVDYTK